MELLKSDFYFDLPEELFQVEHDAVCVVDTGVSDHTGVVAGHEHHAAAESFFCITLFHYLRTSHAKSV